MLLNYFIGSFLPLDLRLWRFTRNEHHLFYVLQVLDQVAV